MEIRADKLGLAECKRCGDPEFRIDGFCTIECRDLYSVQSDLRNAIKEIRNCHAQNELAPGMECTCNWCTLPNDYIDGISIGL